MKWFWYSLIGFCVLICACKTKESAYLLNEVSEEHVQTEVERFKVLVDTGRIYKFGIDKTKLKITETIITRKYDKDTGAITEETKTKRKVTQDTDQVVAKEESESVTDCNGLEVDHSSKETREIDRKEVIKEESAFGGLMRNLGKWLGIGLCVILFTWMIWSGLKKGLSLRK